MDSPPIHRIPEPAASDPSDPDPPLLKPRAARVGLRSADPSPRCVSRGSTKPIPIPHRPPLAG